MFGDIQYELDIWFLGGLNNLAGDLLGFRMDHIYTALFRVLLIP